MNGYWLSDDSSACKWNTVESSISKPDDQCTGLCYESYLTYKAIAHKLGRKPTTEEILGMTATAEYYPYIHRSDAGNLRYDAQEALARNFYSACGGDDNLCTDNQIYTFMSGYEPWWRHTGGATSESRANDILGKYNDNPYKTELEADVAQILDFSFASDPQRDWTSGQLWHRPWQWRNVDHKPSQSGDLYSNYGAIMYITLAPGSGYFGDYFWIVTGRQDWCYKYPNDPTWCKK